MFIVGISRPILDEDFKKICLQFFRLTFQGQMSRSIFWVIYNQSVNFIHKDLEFFTLKFKSEVNKYFLNKGQRLNQWKMPCLDKKWAAFE